MSMISAQIDELRELAGDGSMEWVSGPIRASVLRDAADTIWELRDDLQRANAENAKLRELVRIAGTYCVNGLCGKDDGCPLWLGKPYCALPDRMRELGVRADE